MILTYLLFAIVIVGVVVATNSRRDVKDGKATVGKAVGKTVVYVIGAVIVAALLILGLLVWSYRDMP